mgnify:CR=1 FL=1
MPACSPPPAPGAAREFTVRWQFAPGTCVKMLDGRRFAVKRADTAVVVEAGRVWKDAYGNPLADGDTVTVIKDLKIKGSSSVVKVGTKVKNIRLVDGDHDIDCKIDGIGAMQLKSEFVKKA